jgi:hypothetical protein
LGFLKLSNNNRIDQIIARLPPGFTFEHDMRRRCFRLFCREYAVEINENRLYDANSFNIIDAARREIEIGIVNDYKKGLLSSPSKVNMGSIAPITTLPPTIRNSEWVEYQEYAVAPQSEARKAMKQHVKTPTVSEIMNTENADGIVYDF